MKTAPEKSDKLRIERLGRAAARALPDAEQDRLRSEAFALRAKGKEAARKAGIADPNSLLLTGPDSDRLADLLRCGMLPADPPPPRPITRDREPYLTELARQRNAAGGDGQFVPAFLKSEAEAERVRGLQAELTAKALGRIIADHPAREAEASHHGAAAVRSEKLCFDPSSDIPAQRIKALVEASKVLSLDERQVVNLRWERDGRGKPLTFAEVAKRFKGQRKPGKRYTGEHCRTLYNKAFAAVVSEAKRAETDAEAIADWTGQIVEDRNATHGDGFRVTANPRKPPKFGKSAHVKK
jgi:hypothetical protein